MRRLAVMHSEITHFFINISIKNNVKRLKYGTVIQ
jgi:hypothetical protein